MNAPITTVTGERADLLQSLRRHREFLLFTVKDLTDEQALACAFRILAHGGFSENMAGHITWQRPGDEHMLVNHYRGI